MLVTILGTFLDHRAEISSGRALLLAEVLASMSVSPDDAVEEEAEAGDGVRYCRGAGAEARVVVAVMVVVVAVGA